MPTAKVFMNGNSQAVRLPKEFRVEGAELVIKRMGDALLLLPKRYSAAALSAALAELPAAFRIEREQPAAPQERDFG